LEYRVNLDATTGIAEFRRTWAQRSGALLFRRGLARPGAPEVSVPPARVPPDDAENGEDPGEGATRLLIRTAMSRFPDSPAGE